MAQVVRFYSTRDAFGCFSNFSKHPVTARGALFPTSEHYFQAMKFIDSKADWEAVLASKTAMMAAKIGRDRTRKLRKDWDQVKDSVMFEVCLAKFTQNKDIRQVLLSTGAATLVEHTRNDAYWGDGGDGSGKNMLGKTLMRVRETLACETADKTLHVEVPSKKRPRPFTEVL